MPRRVIPESDDVADALAPVRRARRRRVRADVALLEAVRSAAAADPRPTNRQIGDAAGVSESRVRQLLADRDQ